MNAQAQLVQDYTFLENAAALQPGDIPADSIISRTLHRDEDVKVVLFGFADGQELSEHTSSQPAMLHFLQGRARLTLGPDEKEVKQGAWVHMPAQLPHRIVAEEPTLMLLYLLR